MFNVEAARIPRAEELALELKRENRKLGKLICCLESHLDLAENASDVSLTTIRISESIAKISRIASEIEWLYEEETNIYKECDPFCGKTNMKEYSITGDREKGFAITCPLLPVQRQVYRGRSKAIAKGVENLLKKHFTENSISAPVYSSLCDVDITMQFGDNSMMHDAHNAEFKHVVDAMIGFFFPDDNSSHVQLRLRGESIEGEAATRITIRKA